MTDKAPASPSQPTLRHLEQLMAQLLEGVILMDPTGAIVGANAAALAMHGVTSIEELGLTAEGYAQRFSLRGDNQRPLKHREYPLFRLLAGESFADTIVEVAPAGEEETRWVHQVRDVVMDEDGGEPDCLALVINDVSARFDAVARFKAMFQANPAPAIIIRLSDQKIVEVNPGFEALTGFAPDRLIGRTIFGLDLLTEIADAAVRRRIEAGEVITQTEAELLVADGSRRLVIFAGQPIEVTGEDALLLTFADLEPQRQAQRALAESERDLSAVFEMAPVALMVARTTDNCVASTNAAFRALTGLADADVVGRGLETLEFWESAELRARAGEEIEANGGFRNWDGQLLRDGGEIVHCLISAEAITVGGAPSTLWLFQDITERRRTELELVEAIDAVLKDANWLSRSIIDKLATLRRPGRHAPAADLSPREREILALICDDLDDVAIAERLGLSRNTVRNHVARIYAKIGVNRRSGAVIWGRERGMGSRSA